MSKFKFLVRSSIVKLTRIDKKMNKLKGGIAVPAAAMEQQKEAVATPRRPQRCGG